MNIMYVVRIWTDLWRIEFTIHIPKYAHTVRGCTAESMMLLREKRGNESRSETV